MVEMQTDVLIAGGGLGGCAAALAACRQGFRVVLTEETDWIGGQLTQQAVPPDEHPWIEQFGCTRSYRQFRNGVRRHYLDHYPLSTAAHAVPHLNPGNGSVSRLCHEPRVALAVLEAMLAPYRTAGRLVTLLRHRPLSADADGDSVRAVTFADEESGHAVTVTAPYILDATELGDLLPLAGVEYVTGAESISETDEMHAPDGAHPANMQAITWCFAVDYRPGEDHTIERPERYDFWRDYVPDVRPHWPGRQLAWPYSHPHTLQPNTLAFDPLEEGKSLPRGFWTYRRLVDRENYAPGFCPSDVCLVNWPHNDYLLGNVCEVTEEEQEYHLEGARQLSLSLLYWMQTEAPRADGGTGWPGLRPRGDITGTLDGLAKRPYIRESRRIRSAFTVLEGHIGLDQRLAMTGLPREEVRPEVFPDSVGVGYYRIDLHPSTGGDNYIDIASLPFQIPLGALVPVRVRNLLPACKNLGVTHITNGCYRLHPVEWNIGEAAGLLAAFCLRTGAEPAQVHTDAGRLREFQGLLSSEGVEMAWPQVPGW